MHFPFHIPNFWVNFLSRKKKDKGYHFFFFSFSFFYFPFIDWSTAFPLSVASRSILSFFLLFFFFFLFCAPIVVSILFPIRPRTTKRRVDEQEKKGTVKLSFFPSLPPFLSLYFSPLIYPNRSSHICPASSFSNYPLFRRKTHCATHPDVGPDTPLGTESARRHFVDDPHDGDNDDNNNDSNSEHYHGWV